MSFTLHADTSASTASENVSSGQRKRSESIHHVMKLVASIASGAAIIYLGLCGLAAVPAAAQVRQQLRPQVRQQVQHVVINPKKVPRRSQPEAAPVLISVSAPIENLIRKAEEGIDRRQWKLAIDSLQRVIESPERSLVPTADSRRYESIRNVALDMLSSLPEEALASYHLLYDGKASAMYERARSQHDLDQLQIVVDRYLLTDVGGRASTLLASWLLDEGKAADALAIVEDIETYGAADEALTRNLVLKKAAALVLLERSDAASLLLGSDVGRQAWGDRDRGAFVESVAVARQWQRSAAADYSDPQSWSVEGGRNSRDGVMPAVNPTVRGAIPWRFELDETRDFEWRPLVTDDPMGPLVQPPGSLAIDGNLVFLRTPSQLLALDATTLRKEWAVRFPAREARVETNIVTRRGLDSFVPYDRDHAAWAVSAHDGQVYVLQRHTSRTDGIRRSVQGYRPFPTWLTAFDQATGDMRWQVGREEDFPHPLADVEIRSVPIMVEGNLWLTCQRQRDLFLLCLNPADGEVIRSILICTLPSAATPTWLPLDPAYDDGTIFVPTGEGMLIAVRTRDGNLLWATQYADSVTPTVASPPLRPPNRLVTPPIATNGLVLLAPTESNEVLAVSAENGSILWQSELEGTSYIVGADGGRLFLGGRMLTARSVSDGSIIWSKPVDGAPTGRTVLSGSMLLTPTWEKFFARRTEDGGMLSEQSIPAGLPPLGRLVCVKNTMYSVDPNLVRKFPDVERAYPEAVADYEAEPDNATNVVRLAWMELLKERPSRAHDVVREYMDGRSVADGVANDGAANDGAPYKDASRELARVRVTSLLAMAAEAGEQHSQSLRWLDEAESFAESGRDRLRVKMAYADRLRVSGDVIAAYRKLVELGTAPASRGVTLRDGLTNYSIRLDLSRQLAALETQLSVADRNTLIGEVSARFAALIDDLLREENSQQAVAVLDGLIRLNLLGESTIDALFALSDLRMDQQRFEQAEQLVRESIRRAASRETRVRALMRHYETVAGASEFPGSAHEAALTLLETDFGSSIVPGLDDMTVAQWVELERKRLEELYGPQEPTRVAQRQGFDGSVAWAPIRSRLGVRRVLGRNTPNRPWTGTAQTDAVIVFEGKHKEVLGDRLFIINDADIVQCLHAANGALLWETELGFPFESELSPIVELQSASDAGLPVTAAVDGQTAVFRGASGLHAVGLISGKRIWSVPYESYKSFPGGYRESIALAAGPGWVVGTPRGGRLSLIRTLDGSTVWERDLRGELVTSIRVTDDRIVTFDPDFQRVHILDASDGRLIERLLFHQPDRPSRLVDIVLADGVICGPIRSSVGTDGVKAFSIADGKPLWEKVSDKPLTQVFAPASGLIGLGDLSGRLQLMKAATGEVVHVFQNRTIQRVTEAALVEGVLLVRHVNPAFRSVAIIALDVESGEQLWVHGGLASMSVARRPLEVIDGRVIVISDQRSSRGRIEPLRGMFVDLFTGEQVGDSVDLMYSPKKNWRQVVYRTFPGIVVFGTPENIMPFVYGR